MQTTVSAVDRLMVDDRRILPIIPSIIPAIAPYIYRAPNGLLNVPDDARVLLQRYGLTVGDLLTVDNPKTAKRSDLARTAILHHLPSRGLARAIDPRNKQGGTRAYIPELAALAADNGLADTARRFNACGWATQACIDCCLNQSGHGGMSLDCASCRGRRQLCWLDDPIAYARAMLWAIARERSRTLPMIPLAVRLRGTSDEAWHTLRFSVSPLEAAILHRRFGIMVNHGDDLTMADALAIERANGRIVLYDYSAAPLNGPLGILAQRSAGWDVTHSVKPDRPTACADALAAIRAGFRVAIPVAMRDSDPIPASLSITTADDSLIIPTVNGDASDHRWADPGRCAVILRYKVARGASPDSVARFAIPNHGTVALADGIVGWVS